MAYCSVFCGASEETIREVVTTGEVEIYGAGSSFTITKEFVDVLLSLDIEITNIRLNGILSVGKDAFRHVKGEGLIEFDFGDTLESIDEYAFAQSNIISIVELPPSIKYIKNGAFFDCSSLLQVIFHLTEDDTTSLEYIGMSAFQDDTSLQVIYADNTANNSALPEGLKKIDAYAFARCTGFSTELTLPDSLETIGAYAFAWSSFTKLHLGCGLSTRSGQLPLGSDLEYPHQITLCSKRQFRYYHVDVSEPINRIQLPDEFICCVNDDQFMVFRNGRLIPHGSVLSHPVDGTPLYEYEIYIDIPNAQSGDSLDIFYVPEILKPITDYVENLGVYKTPEADIEGIVEPYEYIKSYKYLPGDQRGFLKLNTPLYNFSNKNSMFIFVNGRKVDIDSIWDVSTATMRITKYIQVSRPEEAHYPIQLLSFADNEKINSFVFSKDGLSHSRDQVNIVPFESLESYNKLSILDKMLYGLPIPKLEVLFPRNLEFLEEDDAVGVRYDKDILVQRLYNIHKEEGDGPWYQYVDGETT